MLIPPKSSNASGCAAGLGVLGRYGGGDGTTLSIGDACENLKEVISAVIACFWGGAS
jgi:hypothetical protein